MQRRDKGYHRLHHWCLNGCGKHVTYQGKGGRFAIDNYYKCNHCGQIMYKKKGNRKKLNKGVG